MLDTLKRLIRQRKQQQPTIPIVFNEKELDRTGKILLTLGKVIHWGIVTLTWWWVFVRLAK